MMFSQKLTYPPKVTVKPQLVGDTKCCLFRFYISKQFTCPHPSSFSTQTTDIEITVDDKSFRTFYLRSVGVQVDTFSSNKTNVTNIYVRQQ